MKTKKNFFITALWTLLVIACNNDSAPKLDPDPVIQTDAAVINRDDKKQIIRGFGAATVFRLNTPLNDAEMDLLFNNGPGELGLSILRIRVASDQNPTARAIELEHAKGAKERGAKIIASPWSPPARIKTNNSLIGGQLKLESYDEYALYLNDFVEYMAENNAALYAVSVQNEPDIEVDYESSNWTSGQLHNFVLNHADKIKNTKVMAAESFNFNHAMTDPILKDPAALENIDIIAGHIYGGGLTDYPLAREKGKEVWMTEHLDTKTTWDAVFATAREIHKSMAIANFNAYVWWYAKRFYGPIDEEGVVTKRGVILSHYSKFIRPGYYRIAATVNPKENVFVSAYSGDEATVIVAINTGIKPVAQQFALKNGSEDSFIPYTTTKTENLVPQTIIEVDAEINAFKALLPPQSITTFTSKG